MSCRDFNRNNTNRVKQFRNLIETLSDGKFAITIIDCLVINHKNIYVNANMKAIQ